MKKRALPKATAKRVQQIEAAVTTVGRGLEAESISMDEAELAAAHLTRALEALLLEDGSRTVGRPRSKLQSRGTEPTGMLAPYLPKPPKPEETRGRKPVWPAGYATTTYNVVTQYMERDGLGVTAAIKKLLAATTRKLNLRESRAVEKFDDIRALYYQGRDLAKKAQKVAKSGEAD